ncbi:rod shape-determining protein [Natroniella sulfidigena]|uniref:cell division protein FtsA n=1 Tax=Natroniella sulfidigena TaxID=723921 RepID=UPI00200B1C58|nr:cell division FtsA domain-containing protein [Natroniella sulfidigena]MCK8817258.1 rod shape-determining protein [Natroniella sulfidigena]
MQEKDDLIFALDIGTRTVVGVLLEPTADDRLIVKASEVIEHKNRSMIDGQIHNVEEVATQVEKIKTSLERKCDTTLNKVGIAAAGRALKTVTGHCQLEFDNKREVTTSDVQTLEFSAVQNAQEKLVSKGDQAEGYHFVGYTLLQNMLDGMKLGNLVGQSGKKIEVDLIATFLPRIVIDSLLTVIRQADLEVDHLTLEPIAASNLIVPRRMYNFNLALVDIGAGTSDIAITKEGSIIGYAMVPVAGDEITEAICQSYMLDYHKAEEIKRKLLVEDKVEIKDILDQVTTVATSSVIKMIEDEVESLAQQIADEILSLNQQQPQAVICIGGGSLTPLLKEKLAKKLELPVNRVGVKDCQEVNEIEGTIDGVTETQSITPFGIGITCYKNNKQVNFIDIEVNGDLIHLFTLRKPKVSDALLAAEIDITALKPNPGLAISVEVNGDLKVIRGSLGTAGRLLVNGTEAELEDEISHGDQLTVELGEQGENAYGVIADVVPELPSRKIYINETEVVLEPIYYMNEKPVSADTELKDRANITYTLPQTVKEVVEQILEFPVEQIKKRKISYTFNGAEREYQYQNYRILLNGKEVSLDQEVDSGDHLSFEEVNKSDLKIKDLLDEVKVNSTINVTFNNQPVEVPLVDFQLLKNGKTAQLEDQIFTGDEIVYQPGTVQLNQLLSHINYELPTNINGRLIIEKNGQAAQLIEPLEDGDQVKIYVEDKRSDIKVEDSMKKKKKEGNSLERLQQRLQIKLLD